MGYPMTYKRVVGRNHLVGDYNEGPDKPDMFRHFSQDKYPGTNNLDQLAVDLIWNSTTYLEKTNILRKLPSCAQTLDFYEKHPAFDGLPKVMAVRRLLEAVESATIFSQRCIISGDMRRLEKDQLDDDHLTMYAEKAGITKEQAKVVLQEFIAGTF